MFNKIVDMVAVDSRMKPLHGGKCERWWKEHAIGNHGVKKISTNRSAAGKDKDTDLGLSVAETLSFHNFKGFEFGNWLSQAERYDVFVAFQYCLADMYQVIKTENFGFDRNIGVAFAARGSRGAAAHYEPLNNIINLTKRQGAGSFIHEYAHAVDYNIGSFFDQTKKYSALSGGHTVGQPIDNVGGQFRAMMNKILIYARSTESYKRMLGIPYFRMNLDYWGNSTEMFARLTEAYFAYFFNPNNNHYLCDPVANYEAKNKKYGTYLSKAELEAIKPEIDKFWGEVTSLLNNKCTLKTTPFPKIETSNQHSATEIYKIVEETLAATDKKKLKSRFQNRYNLTTRISKGKGLDYTVISDLPTKEIIFNDAERQEFSKLLSEALNKAGIKHTKTENGGNDGRKFYYRIEIENVFRSKAEPNVRFAFSFVDAEPKEEKKGKTKVMELPKQFVVGCTYISDYGKISDKKGHITVLERKGDMLKFKRLDGTGVFERKINESAGGTEYVADGHYQGSIKWSATNELKYSKWLESLSKGKGNPKAEKGYKEMYCLTVNHSDKPYITIESLKMGEDHMLRIYGVNQQKKNDSSLGGINSSSLPSTLTMAQYKDILAYANGYDKKSQKMLVDTLARLGWFKDSKMTPAEKKQAAADFIKETTGKKGKGVKKEPKADSSKKKVEKRPDKLSFDFGKFVLKGKLLPNEQKKIALQYAWEKENYRVASDMFKLVYEKLENSLEDGYARVFDKHNNLVYAGKDSQKAYGVFPDFEAAVAIKPKKDVKLDIQKLSKSIEEIKAIVKENKAKLKKFPKRPVMSTMPKGYEDAYYKSQWIDTATFVIDSVKFNYETVSAMLYVNKMWNLDTLLIESPYRGCMMQNEDGSKKAFFMPVTIYGDDGELNSLSDKQKKMLKERGYFIGL